MVCFCISNCSLSKLRAKISFLGGGGGGGRGGGEEEEGGRKGRGGGRGGGEGGRGQDISSKIVSILSFFYPHASLFVSLTFLPTSLL